MTTPKFTPGPWETCGHHISPVSTHDSPCNKGIRIATTFGIGEEHQANATLIASAPDLYAALELALVILQRDVRNNTSPEGVLNVARAALAKARGMKGGA